jgi:hypothetical protein
MSARGFSSAEGEGGAGAGPGAGADAGCGREVGGAVGAALVAAGGGGGAAAAPDGAGAAGALAAGAEDHVEAGVGLPGATVPDGEPWLDGAGVNAAVEAGADGAGAAAAAEVLAPPAGVPSACATATDGLVGCAAATDGLVGCAAATDGLVGCEVPDTPAGFTLATSPSLMMATTVLMGTVAPGSTRISLSTPEAGAGISASTLSVEISKSGSSRCTRSPTFFIHLVIVPSAIDSPIWGMMTSVISNHPMLDRKPAWPITHRSRARRRPPPPA